MVKAKTLAMNIKKIVPWGNGLAIYLTKEAKELGWNTKTRVVVSIIENQEGKAIIIREATISKR
jgi:hypothetical protein